MEIKTNNQNSVNEKESVNMDKQYDFNAMVEASVNEAEVNGELKAEEVAKEGFKLFSKEEIKNILKSIKKYGTSDMYDILLGATFIHKKVDLTNKLKSLKKEYSKDATVWNKILSIMSIVFVKLAQVVFGIGMFTIDVAVILGVMTGRIAKNVLKESLIAASGIKGAFKNDIVAAIRA